MSPLTNSNREQALRPGGLHGMLPAHALLKIVTENAHIGLVIVSPDRRYLYANTTYAEILGLPSSGLVGRSLQDVLAGVYEDQVSPRLDRAFAGERLSYELRRSGPAGERYYSVSYEPIDVDGSVAMVAVVISEITERKQMVADSDRFAAIVASSDDAIIGKNLDGIVTSWNRGAERLFGYSAAEMVGASITRLIPADRQGEEASILEKLRKNESVQHFETVRQTKEGRSIDVSVTASPIKDSTGAVIGASKVARDISARKRADEELRFQQTMLTTERELTLDGIIVVDPQSRVLSFNRRFAQMWGISDDILATGGNEVLRQAMIDQLADPERFLERGRYLYDRHDETSTDEVPLRDGRVFDRYSAPMRNPDGHYYGRVWYFRDVTERKLAEAAVRQERDRAQQYLDAAEVILLALDLEGRITLINRKGCDLLGWTEAELVGRSWIEICLPERVRPTLHRKFSNLVDGETSVVENPVLTRAGGERMIEWRNTVLRDRQGRPTGTLSSGTDITERHEAIEALRVAEERMRFALQAANVGIWDMDYRSGVLRWSETLEAQYGLEPGTFGGTFDAFIEQVHPADRAMLLETVGKAMKSGADFSVLNRTIWPDGSVRWLSGEGRVLLDQDGQPIRAVGVTLDVTDRRSLEDQYHQAQKMEAVGQLAGGVAHDFNNLLTAILGRCELLLEDLGPSDPRRLDVVEIHRAGESAAGLTRQLLAFSRKEIIEPTLLDLNAVIRDIRGMLSRLIGEDLKIVTTLEPKLATIKADRGQMEQIVLNLVVNARDAMPGGGTLTIETENTELDEHYANRHFSVRPGRYVALTVSDTGIGMPPDVQARVFEPFFTTKELGKGTGLGLATVHGIVMQSGGSVNVYSELDHGTSFRIYLPCIDRVDLVAEAPNPGARPRATGETVLVVEDADGLRDLTRRLLERQGYKVLVAANAAEALAQCERNGSIDVVLTDVVMPGTSGPELARRLTAQRPSLKVLYMSGYTGDTIAHHGMLDAGIAFLHKPFTAESLGRKLREVLEA